MINFKNRNLAIQLQCMACLQWSTINQPQYTTNKESQKWLKIGGVKKKILFKPLEEKKHLQKESGAPGVPTPVHVVGRPGGNSHLRCLLRAYPVEGLGAVCCWQQCSFNIRTNLFFFRKCSSKSRKISNDQLLWLGDCSHLMEKLVKADNHARSINPKKVLENWRSPLFHGKFKLVTKRHSAPQFLYNIQEVRRSVCPPCCILIKAKVVKWYSPKGSRMVRSLPRSSRTCNVEEETPHFSEQYWSTSDWTGDTSFS